MGMCGEAARVGKTLIADDVSTHLSYISGSDLVKSEIAVPLMSNGRVLGVMNVESYFPDTFSQGDDHRKFVEFCAEIVAKYLAQHPWN
jgi:L-methionine (R)-S-oxide reductase